MSSIQWFHSYNVETRSWTVVSGFTAFLQQLLRKHTQTNLLLTGGAVTVWDCLTTGTVNCHDVGWSDFNGPDLLELFLIFRLWICSRNYRTGQRERETEWLISHSSGSTCAIDYGRLCPLVTVLWSDLPIKYVSKHNIRSSLSLSRWLCCLSAKERIKPP